MNDTHMDVWQAETAESARERSWMEFIGEVEVLMGHGADGDQAEDGYSMDGFARLWEVGFTPRQAVAEVGKLVSR